MSNDTIENSATAQQAPEKPKAKSKATKKAKGPKKPARKAPGKPKAERASKKAEAIANEATQRRDIAEIVKATGWQRNTVRGFVSILGSKGGEKIESSKNTAGERT